MGEGKIAVETWLQSFHVIDEQVGLKGMAGPCRWNRPEHRVRTSNLFHALCTPEQKGQFWYGERFPGVGADTVPFFNYSSEIQGRNNERPWSLKFNYRLTWIRRDLKGRLGQTPLLVRGCQVPGTGTSSVP